MLSANLLDILHDPSFPEQTIKHFSAVQFNLSEEELLGRLYQALSVARQNPENKRLLEKALTYKINASSDVILMINTNAGLQLLYANSQRRRRLVSTNGACEPGESLAESAHREFCEELGNPRKNGLIEGMISRQNNRRSLKFKNKIGNTLAEMANRIIDLQADRNKLFVNVSSIFVNESPVSINTLRSELAEMNARLRHAAPFYMQAVKLIFGDRKAGIKASDFTTYAEKDAACTIINNFSVACQAIITDEMCDLFSHTYDVDIDSSQIKKALVAIIDLTENDEVGLLSRQELEPLLSVDYSVKENLDALMKEYFDPSFMSLVIHKGELSAKEFLGQYENLAARKIKFGLSESPVDSEHTNHVVNNNYNTKREYHG